MRSVSSATWTSAGPVSPSERPNLPISSCFFSFVSDMRWASGTSEASTEPARLLRVAAHLRDQVLDARKAPLAAKAGDERDAQALAVEVAVEVEQVGLDEEPAAGLEGRAHADVHGGRLAVGEGRVHPVPRADEVVRRDDVGRREAQAAAAAVARDHLALEQEGSA